MGARLTRALSRIPDEFVGQPFYQAFMTSIVARLEESDQILADLATMRWIDTAEGVWLDTVGEIVGIPRFYEPITEGIFTYNGFGPELLVDGDMDEFPDARAWTVFGNALLTKKGPGAKQGDLYLEVAYTDTNIPAARQIGITVAGKRYSINAWARSQDGISVPGMTQGSVVVWTGTNSTKWQRVTASWVAAGSSSVFFRMEPGFTGAVAFDACSIREAPPDDPDLGYSGLPAPGAGGIYNSVNGLFSDTLIDDDTYRRYIKAKAKATGTPGTLTDIYTFIKDAFEVESIVTTSGTRAVTVELLEGLTQGQKLQLKRWAPLSAAVSIRVIGP